VYTLGEFWVPEIHWGRLREVSERRARKHAGVRLYRARKHERARAVSAGGAVERA
jgi:hypothetical protein